MTKGRARRLKTISRWINEHLGQLGYRAVVVQGYCNTDRKIKGTRLRSPGRGRYGNRLIVRRGDTVVLDHNAAETYRHNSEVEYWLRRELEKRGIPQEHIESGDKEGGAR